MGVAGGSAVMVPVTVTASGSGPGRSSAGGFLRLRPLPSARGRPSATSIAGPSCGPAGPAVATPLSASTSIRVLREEPEPSSTSTRARVSAAISGARARRICRSARVR